MHCDYPNHTLTHPSPWYDPEAVSIILYLSDVDDCQGATAVVPRTGKDDPAYTYPQSQMPGFGGTEWVNNKKLAEEYLQQVAPDVAEYRAKHLYAREKGAVQVRYRFVLPSGFVASWNSAEIRLFEDCCQYDVSKSCCGMDQYDAHRLVLGHVA